MFVCKICHSPSRDPHLSMCCGQTFCKSRLDNAIARKAIAIFLSGVMVVYAMFAPCVVQKILTHAVPNKYMQRSNESSHFCTNKDKGCPWQGEISIISLHLKNGDEY